MARAEGLDRVGRAPYPALMTQHQQAPAQQIDGLSEISDRYDVVLSDIWGVVHNGLAAFAPACAALQKFRAKGGLVVLITNAPRPNGPISAQLRQLGAPHDICDAVVTSGDVTAAQVAAREGQSLFHIGPAHDLALLDVAAQKMRARPAMVPLEQADYVLCTGLFNDEHEQPQDYDSRLLAAKKRGLTMICANPDLVVHRGEKLVYCGGALGERYQHFGGTTLYAGKPHAPIYEACLAQAEALRGGKIARERVLAIGDALRTDIAGALAQQLDILMISNGLHRDEMHRDGKLDMDLAERLFAQSGQSPTYVMKDLRWA